MFTNTRRFSKRNMFDQDYELAVNRQYLPLNNLRDSFSLDDEFYNRKEFQSNYKNKRTL
jgi:hypothetical protein